MNITLVCVGKIKENYIKDAVSEYTKRLSKYCNLKIVEVDDERAPENISSAQEEIVKKKEGETD
jgi:23S rRNA (pseudouridine1915-N3)-methyltransferase